MDQKKQCKIILLTGYLGSGKTTLLQYILKTQTTYQVAVIQNEFSDEMGIEAPQMIDNNGELFESFLELPNGCICCSTKGQLVTAIQYFFEKKPNIQFIIIESNGLADPSKIIKDLWLDEGLKLPIELHAIIGLVASHRYEQLCQQEIFRKQIIFANLILLNFKDKTESNEIQKIQQQLSIVNPCAQFQVTEKALIDIDSIFSFVIDETKIFFNQDHSKLEHIHGIQKYFMKISNQNITQTQWNMNVGQLLWETDCQIVRIKGLLYCKDEDIFYSLQGVEEIFEIVPTNLDSSKVINAESKILIIGYNLNQTLISDILMQI